MMRRNRKNRNIAYELVFATPIDKAIKTAYRKKGLKQTRKNYKGSDYCSTYLQRNEINGKKSIFISKEVHNRVSKFLSSVDNKNTVDGFFDIVMLKHMEQYKEQMNELYKQKKENLN